MIVPIKKVIRNSRVLSLLESQFPKSTELGVELVETNGRSSVEIYRLYTKMNGNDYSRDRFVIERIIRSGKVREYVIDGKIIIKQ